MLKSFRIIRSYLLVAFLLITSFAEAQLRLPEIFADHMVMQQQSSVPLWGWCWPGSEVVITPGWSKEEVKVKTSNTGMWSAKISTPTAGGPYSISIKSGAEIVLQDVLIGEVWLCSGQSNMEWSMKDCKDGKEAFPNANHPSIRLFQVKKSAADFPQVRAEGNWVVTTPETAQYFSAVGYFFGKKLHEQLNVPIGLINASWGGTPAEVWLPDSLVYNDKVLAEAAGRQQVRDWWPSKPGVVFNSMIYPFTSMPIAGVIWYQGESNTAAPGTYKPLMEQLILSWREGFGKDFPFYYVQIAPYSGYGDDSGVLIREQQVKMLDIPNTGMVVISDHVDDVKDIHPQFKKPVGERLAHVALAKTYHQSGVVYQYPLYGSMKIEKKKIRVSFKDAPGGLMSKGGEPTEFLIAGADKKFYPAKATIEGSTVVVSAKEVKEPVAVRFGWSNSSIPNLFSKEGLPVPSFRTDDW